MEKHVPCRARALRLRYGVTLSELAGACGVSTQLISKIELERERQTPAHERMLRNAFIAIIDRRRARLDDLETELARCGGLFQTTEGDEYGNIGKLMDFKRVLNVCRGSAIFCQIIVQSIPQLQDRYPKTEWEELIGCTDIQICLGCNDVDTATYISKKCGMVTIKVENNQMPLMPLFSPVYTSTRPYSQTKSNTQRPLMCPDEIMRMDNQECLVLLRGQKPMRLYKIIPDEHPSFGQLRDVKVSDYVPHWRNEEEKPKSKPSPSPEPPREQPTPPAEQRDAPPAPPPPGPPSPPQGEDPAPPPSDSASPPKPSSGWGPKYDYGLLDPVDGFDGAEQEPDSGQEAPYGGFDLIESPPQDVGGDHKEEGQR